MRLKIKDFSKISYTDSIAVMNGALIINIETKGLDERLKKKMISQLVLQINRR